MSLIGPRPLLPVDQPKKIRYRLQVRPGLTGLAQINGGTLLSPEEKDALDEWYVEYSMCSIKISLQWTVGGTRKILFHDADQNNCVWEWGRFWGAKKKSPCEDAP